VVLTDMMMPVMDGPTMIEVLVRMDPKVRIVATSGLHTHAQTARAHGNVLHFIPKPYTAESMLTSLRRALDS
jgi:two-component system, cell cycle sensor histidine kinase and response regulator CckA